MRCLAAVLIIAQFACFNSKKTQTEEISRLLTPEEISLSFERTVCFGTCPAYKIIIKNDGTCLYEGYKYTERLGNYEAKISIEKFHEIQEEAKRVGFFEMQDEYDASVTDVPSVYISIAGPNGIKKVIDRFEAPDELKNFEKYLDSVLLNLDWKESVKWIQNPEE